MPPKNSVPNSKRPRPHRPRSRSHSISSTSSSASSAHSSSSDDTPTETPQAKRVRLAQAFLSKLSAAREEEGQGVDAAEIDREILQARLGRFASDASVGAGTKFKCFSPSILLPTTEAVLTSAKIHKSPVCACAISDAAIFSAGKDGAIQVYSLANGARVRTIHRARPGSAKSQSAHTGQVLALAVSADGKFLASAGQEGKVIIWSLDATQVKFFHAFDNSQSLFRSRVTALAFRFGVAGCLFAASEDRCVKVFDVPARAYVDSLYGHQDKITDIAALASEQAVTAGSRDRTLRLWKIADNSQLVFRAGGKSKIADVLDGLGAADNSEDDMDPQAVTARNRARKGQLNFVENSVDCIAMVDDSHFVSGGDSGSVCLWHTGKKKPIYTRSLSHGISEYHSATEGIIKLARPITAIGAVPYGDIVASGSYNGEIRIWALDAGLKKLEPIKTIPALGFINCIRFKIMPSTEGIDFELWRKHQLSGRAPAASSVQAEAEESVQLKKTPSFDALDLVLVAAIGREERLGRWTKLESGQQKGDRLIVARLCKGWIA